jgi:cyanate permease
MKRFRKPPRHKQNILRYETLRAGGEPPKTSMGRHIFSIALSLVAAVTSGAIFLDSLFHQFAMVEVAAGLLTGLQVFFLSSAIGDMLEKRKKASRLRNSWVFVFMVFLIAFYSFTRYFR